MRKIKNTNGCGIGGAGFLGSHLVNHLINDRSCKVLVLDNLITGKKNTYMIKVNLFGLILEIMRLN